METKSDRKDVVLNSTKTVPILTFSKNLVVSLVKYHGCGDPWLQCLVLSML
jgi:hypothetical protein